MKELKKTKLALQPLLPSFIFVIALVILALIREGENGGGGDSLIGARRVNQAQLKIKMRARQV